MRITFTKKNQLLASVLVALLFFPLLGRPAGLREESPQLAQTLDEARMEAGELARDADETESLIRSDASWQTHADMLDRVKEHVNNLARITQKLESERSSGSELQEQAADRILPLLKELAAHTTAAINYLNQNKTRPLGDPYTEYLKVNADTAHELASTVSSLYEYEKSMAKIDTLKNKLELNGQKAGI
jgi:hypothetical protein